MTEGTRRRASTEGGGCRRWLILGPSGSGKSTLSRELGARLGLPVVHLDLHYWSGEWVPTPREEWRAAVVSLSSGEDWIMDGNYGGTIADRLPRADVVVLLDLNPLLCLFRVISRRFRDADRPDIPEDCDDRFRLSDATFFWWVLSYRWRSRPRVLGNIRAHPTLPCLHLRSRKDVERFMKDPTYICR